MDPALAALLTDTISHATYTGQDSYGTPTWATPVSHPARIEWRVRRMMTAQGEERISTVRVFLEGTVVVEPRDKLVLSDGTAPAIQRVTRLTDETGAWHHTEVYL
jgi:hypothetical protein